jgi:hypothetical protein
MFKIFQTSFPLNTCSKNPLQMLLGWSPTQLYDWNHMFFANSCKAGPSMLDNDAFQNDWQETLSHVYLEIQTLFSLSMEST